MDIKSLTLKPIDEYELLMTIAQHVQFDRLCFGEDVLVIHLDTDANGLATITDVVTFGARGEAGRYYHSNGRTTRPVILFRPDTDCVSLLLSGERVFCIIKVNSSQIE